MNKWKALRRLFVLTLAVAAVLVILRGHQNDPLKTGMPELQTMDVVDLKYDKELSQIKIALAPKNPDDIAHTVDDVLAMYKWASLKFPPVRCGSDYPIEQCGIGKVFIWLLRERDLPTFHGTTVPLFVGRIEFSLDVVQISKLLKQDPATLEDLVTFHQVAAADTKGTAGFVTAFNNPTIFAGFANPDLDK